MSPSNGVGFLHFSLPHHWTKRATRDWRTWQRRGVPSCSHPKCRESYRQRL